MPRATFLCVFFTPNVRSVVDTVIVLYRIVGSLQLVAKSRSGAAVSLPRETRTTSLPSDLGGRAQWEIAWVVLRPPAPARSCIHIIRAFGLPSGAERRLFP